MRKNLLLIVSLMALPLTGASAQSMLYPQTFDYSEVTLGNGIFKTAEDLNYKTLMAYDVDRLMTPFFTQAGMTDWATKHPNFTNWCEGTFRLDGHVGGHYLTALALAYASCRDTDMKQQLKSRMDYMVDCMDSCQQVFDNNTEGLYGYIGGLPYNNVWTDLYKGNTATFTQYGGDVPFYVMHKIVAGMRDAYIYGGNEKARKCFLKLCDWTINVVSNLTDDQLQGILGWEHGGINEPLADAYQLTGEEKYLEGAKRFCHKEMVDGMQTLNTTFLDNKHANTQVPKYIGFLRIAQNDNKSADASLMEKYRRAANNFWADVAGNRTVALGGNSVDEHFLQADKCYQYITNPNGPESCNSNNMLKLSEDLFADNHDAKYADFYERTMLNHILSTQDPSTGGYVYFTSLRPQHYRVYSVVNKAMWCCVGTGMENHSKYAEFVYTHVGDDSLFVNLFVPSELDNETFALTQTTDFPYSQQSTIKVNRAGKYVMAIRHPGWCTGDYQIKVNGEAVADAGTPGSYVMLNRQWAAGDQIEISLPMQLRLDALPNYDSYVAFSYGPVLLGAKTSTDNLDGLYADEGRMGHCAGGLQKSLTDAPLLIGSRTTVLDSVYSVNQDSLKFRIKSGLYNDTKFKDLTLEPFFKIHQCRYMMYWAQYTPEQYQSIKDSLAAVEAAEQKINERTIDFVATGEQQSDAGHQRRGDFNTGSYNGEYYISCWSGQKFSYSLATKGYTDAVSLMCRYTANDNSRTISIYVEGYKIAEEAPTNQPESGFYNKEYSIPAELLKGKDSITVTFAAESTTPIRSLFYLRLLKDYEGEQAVMRTVPHYTFRAKDWVSGDDGRVSSLNYDTGENTITVNGYQGSNNIALAYDKSLSDSAFVRGSENYLLVKGSPLSTAEGASFLWWLNGCNKGTSVAPTYSYTDTETGDTYILWDITQSGINDYMQGDSIGLSANGNWLSTVFGLTSTAADYSATIKDINYYSGQQAVDIYPCLEKTLGLTSAVTLPKSLPASHNIYTLEGVCVGNSTSLSDLPKGIYIVDGKKIVRK
jgi:DUF1680 family protein